MSEVYRPGVLFSRICMGENEGTIFSAQARPASGRGGVPHCPNRRMALSSGAEEEALQIADGVEESRGALGHDEIDGIEVPAAGEAAS